jgi:ribosome-associated protein
VSPSSNEPLHVTSRIRIPADELDFSYVRSSGPGGQNVNKVATKAVLRWSPATSGALSEAARQRFLSTYASRVTSEGELVLTSQRYREQSRNAADCLEKLRLMVAAIASPPKRRKPTRPSKSAVKRRLESKRKQSEKKQRRRPPKPPSDL